MCGFIVIADYKKQVEDISKLKSMTRLLKYRGPDEEGYSYQDHCFMSHRRLTTLDTHTGQQPFSYEYNGKLYRIVYQGTLYNMIDIKNKLLSLGYTMSSTNDSEVILKSYLAFQEKCLDELEGAFAFVIDDGEKLFIARDQLGVKPLYYMQVNTTLIIASEIKCLLAYQEKAIVDKTGIQELLGLGPSMTPGRTIYKNIYSLRPAHYMTFDNDINIKRYWKLKVKKHTDTYAQSVQKVRELVIESIQKQLLSDVPVSTMLSGGLDSSIITAIASQYNHHLTTYSVTYEDQKKYFHSYDYQTTMDDDYINEMTQRYQADHHQVTLRQSQLIDALKESMIARDMPGMADIDSSFLLFAKEISRTHKICLSGECADEIFGGYPWFYKEELYNLPYFPWMRDFDKKNELFNEKIKALHLKDYIIKHYQESLQEIDTVDQTQQLIYLNIEWFMQTLLTRADSQTMRSSIEIRVPFASTKILQYLFNTPHEYMFHNNEEKGLLRDAFEPFLPQDIAHRKKNPYPKTHSPIYTNMIYKKLKESLKDPSNILYSFFDKNKLHEFVESRGQSFEYPWFGQLMMGPQLMAYFYQMYLWGKIYHIELEL